MKNKIKLYIFLVLSLSFVVSADELNVHSANLSTIVSTEPGAVADASIDLGIVTLVAEKFSTDDWTASEARIVISAEDVGVEKLSDLETITWDANVISGYIPHVDVIIQVDESEDALVFEAAKVNPEVCETNELYPTGSQNTLGRGIIENGSYAWLNSGNPGPGCVLDTNAGFYTHTLSDWQNGPSTSDANGKVISGDTPILRFEIEVDPWIADSEAEISNIQVNGNEYHLTIQDAIDAASDGDVINIAAGTYDGDLTINKELVLSGEDNSNTILSGTATVSSNDVTIEGFMINQSTPQTSVTLDTSSQNLNGITINNNQFDMLGSPAVGILLGNTAGTVISNITISSNTFSGPEDMICNPWKIGGSFGSPLSVTAQSITFDGNTVDKCSTPINLQNSNIDSVTITDNIYTNTDGAVYVWTQDGSNPTGALSNFVFKGNNLDSSNSYGVAFFDSDLDGDTLTDSNFGDGILIANNIFDDIPGAYGLQALSLLADTIDFELNGTHNFWGDNDPGDDINGTVNYFPWYQNSDLTTLHSIQLNGEYYATIQDAIDTASAGDTITVGSGTYEENLTINKQITLDGSDSLTTLKGNHRIESDNVTVQELTLDLTTSPSVGFYLTNVEGVNIINNVFNGPDNKVCNPWKIGGSFGSPVGYNVSDFLFEGNTVNKCSIPINLQDNTLEGITIDNNTFIDTDGVLYIWTQDGSNPTGILSKFVFANNDINSTNTYGVAFFDTDVGGIDPNDTFTDSNFGEGNTINNNKFVDIPGGYGLLSVSILADLTNFSLNSRKNYWGTNDSSVIETLVSNDVDYSPFYITESMNNLGNTVTGDGETSETTLSEETDLSDTSGDVQVKIPAETKVTGPAGWTGEINSPTTVNVSSVTISGAASIDSAIEVGFSGARLTFDKGVRLVILGQAGKNAAYSVDGVSYTQITSTCSGDSQAVGDVLPADSECKIDHANGNDLVIWTKHFTKFVSYTPTSSPSSSPSSSPNTNQGSGGSSSVSTIETEETEEAEEILVTPPTSPIPQVAEPSSQPSGLDGITGAVVGAGESNWGWYIVAALAWVFALFVGIWQYGAMRRKNKGLYF
ncbi:MAG: hypothetical protein Q8Q35_03735 [Nanoarchaeota archaeon]|nr:hypothetical protein [Nanoarchaeota archaeon]